jgi:hypothetical protein
MAAGPREVTRASHVDGDLAAPVSGFSAKLEAVVGDRLRDRALLGNGGGRRDEELAVEAAVGCLGHGGVDWHHVFGVEQVEDLLEEGDQEFLISLWWEGERDPGRGLDPVDVGEHLDKAAYSLAQAGITGWPPCLHDDVSGVGYEPMPGRRRGHGSPFDHAEGAEAGNLATQPGTLAGVDHLIDVLVRERGLFSQPGHGT